MAPVCSAAACSGHLASSPRGALPPPWPGLSLDTFLKLPRQGAELMSHSTWLPAEEAGSSTPTCSHIHTRNRHRHTPLCHSHGRTCTGAHSDTHVRTLRHSHACPFACTHIHIHTQVLPTHIPAHIHRHMHSHTHVHTHPPSIHSLTHHSRFHVHSLTNAHIHIHVHHSHTLTKALAQ